MANNQNLQQFNQLPQYNNTVSVGGKLVQAWYRFHANLMQGVPPADISPVTVGQSPFQYLTHQKGQLIVTGGTGVHISIGRGANGQPINTGQTQGTFMLAANDWAVISYTTAPTVTFFPH